MSRASSSSERSMTSISYLVLAIFILLLAFAVRYYIFFIRGPKRVRMVLDSIHGLCLSGDSPVDITSEFLQRWEQRLQMESCPEQLLLRDSSAMVQDTFHLWYRDSLELPGFSPYVHEFDIVRPMAEEGDSEQ